MSNKKTLSHIIKIVSKFTTVAVVLLSLALVLPASPVSADVETMACPFDSSDGTVVDFSNDRIRSDQNEANSRTDTENISLSAGTYQVKLFGYDKHDDRVNQDQPDESFYISLRDGGQEVAQTAALGDLPDNIETGQKTTIIDDFELNSSVGSALGIHAVYKDDSSPNSLNAACGAFKKEKEDEPDISLKDKRCVDNDGIVEIETPNGLDSYELTNVDTDNTVVDDNDGTDQSYITISDLPDGDYRFEATLDGNFETLTFTIDCPETVSCPWDTSKENVYTFSDERLIAENTTGVTPNEETNPTNVNISAGTYDIEIFTNDRYDGRRNASQPQEQSYLSLRNNSGNEIAKTDETNELADNQKTATEISTDDVEVNSQISKLVGVHAFFDSSSDSPNSHNFTCVKLNEEDEKDDLTGSCSVSPDEVEPGEDVTFSSSVSGGDSPYTFSWDLEDSSDDAGAQNVTTSYSNEGTFDGEVTITDDSGEQITRTCSVRVDEDDDDGNGGGGRLPPRDDDDDDGDVRGDRDVDFGVQCVPGKSSYLIGERATFTAEVSGDVDEDDVEFSWSDGNRLESDDQTASIQYTSAGTKTVQVEAEHDGDTESDTCSVRIDRADAGVTLDDVPYTGPAETAKVIGFLLTLLLLALGGGYLVLKRREGDGIPVGIPTNHS